MRKVTLASTSTRRKEILAKARIAFEVQESGYEEDMTLDMPAEELAEFLSAGNPILSLIRLQLGYTGA